MSNTKLSSSGISFLAILAILFVALKLCKVIAWSWLWVTCPLWGPVTVYIVAGGVVYLWAIINVKCFSTPQQKEQMKRIIEDQKRNASKSKWQLRMEGMQEAQRKAAELKSQRGY